VAVRRPANLLDSYTPHDGAFQLRLPGTWAVRRSRMTIEASDATLGPALWVAAQRAKVVMLGRQVLEYDPAHRLVFAVDLPIASQVTRASRKDPYLRFVMDLDSTWSSHWDHGRRRGKFRCTCFVPDTQVLSVSADLSDWKRA
jgi:AraC-type transcriptional regulator N-terminus